ncbi:sigma-70 family RNA polymerase sigma factor [Amycolatopsis decaplanina]|uniref:RNA polymerase factor sigma-70 n=1 Tax=Amycolatopsis decaplanina DSM 44594 TaxID=1284240 RepID=M2Z681_9PSEU|nr:sigma-70 family RNA polymerase sigma factor [Amycolatopsis decaplanina]EME62767.1 RNA polymerase factor sigma-70 [Amycolatopsis decaplanina DSM 44594]
MLVEEDFERVTAPYRRELLAHCYRMLGSVHDAEELVQETYLRAWRGFGGLEHQSSLRQWLYRIATNVCITELERSGRRPLPSGLGHPPLDTSPGALAPLPHVRWVEPGPDMVFGARTEDPAAVAASRNSMRLALVAALQLLPPKQCAVLLFRDVLKWQTPEVADLLGISHAAVNSALQRARATVKKAAPAEDEVVDVPARRAVLDKYVAAVENADSGALAGIMTENAVWEMPPLPMWIAGRDAMESFIDRFCPSEAGDNRLVRTSANGQPAFAAYLRGSDGVHRAHQINVVSVTNEGIDHIVSYQSPGLFKLFDLPEVFSQRTGLIGA